MRIGLIDVDGHSGFPNLALMKLSAWHKDRGDDVEWFVPLATYDKVYMSKVFTFTPDYDGIINAKEIVKGGTGYGMYNVLPTEIDDCFPDYSLYPEVDYAVGFLTRGCIRKCPWCIVPRKEGYISPYRSWEEIKRPDSNKIVFMDNNVLASMWGIKQIESLADTRVKVDFNQGLDARLIDDRVAYLLSRLHWIRFIRMSCDTEAMIPVVTEAVKRLQRFGVKPYRIFVYCLIRDVEESHRRIKAMDELGVVPFGQPYIDFEGGQTTEEQKHLARWCNMKSIHKRISFEEYVKEKTDGTYAEKRRKANEHNA